MFSLYFTCNGCVGPDDGVPIAGTQLAHEVVALLPLTKEALPTFNELSALDDITLDAVNHAGGLSQGSVLPAAGQFFTPIVIDKQGNYYCRSCAETTAIIIAQRPGIPHCLEGLLSREEKEDYSNAAAELDYKATLVAGAIFIPFGPLFIKAETRAKPVRLNAFSSTNHTIPRFFYLELQLVLDLMLKELNGVQMRLVVTSQAHQEIIAWMTEPARSPSRPVSPSGSEIVTYDPTAVSAVPHTSGRRTSFLDTHRTNTRTRLQRRVRQQTQSGGGGNNTNNSFVSIHNSNNLGGASYLAPDNGGAPAARALRGGMLEETGRRTVETPSFEHLLPDSVTFSPGQDPNNQGRMSPVLLRKEEQDSCSRTVKKMMAGLVTSCPHPLNRARAAFTRMMNSRRRERGGNPGEAIPLLPQDGGENGGRDAAANTSFFWQAMDRVCNNVLVTGMGRGAKATGNFIYDYRQPVLMILVAICIIAILACYFICSLPWPHNLPSALSRSHCESTPPPAPAIGGGEACDGTVAIWNMPVMVAPSQQLAALYDWLVSNGYNISVELFQEVANAFRTTVNGILEWLLEGCSEFINLIAPFVWQRNTSPMPTNLLAPLIRFAEWFIPQVFGTDAGQLPLSLLQKVITYLRLFAAGLEIIAIKVDFVRALVIGDMGALAAALPGVRARFENADFPGVAPLPAA